MRRTFIAGASVALLVLTIASAAVNFRFGWDMGKSTSLTPWFHDGWILGGISVALDFFKIALGIVIVGAFAAKGQSIQARAAVVAVALVLWAPITFYSFNSAFGTAILSRTNGVGTRQVQAENEADLSAERAKLRASKPWTPEIEQWKELPSSAIADKIKAHEFDRLWEATSRCANPDLRVPSERNYCQAHLLLKMAHEAAIKSERTDNRLAEIEAKLSSATGVTVADPQAKAYADLTSIPEDKVRYFWALFIAFLLEFVPNLGPGLLVMYAGVRREIALQTEKAGHLPSVTLPALPSVTEASSVTEPAVAKVDAVTEEHPKLHLVIDNSKQVSPADAEFEAMAREVLAGRNLSPNQAHKRMQKHIPAVSKKAVTQALGKAVAAIEPGAKISSSNNRRYSVTAPKEVSEAKSA